MATRPGDCVSDRVNSRVNERVSDRERALHLLRRIERDAAFATPLLQADADRNGDSGFVRTVVLGVLRWRSRLDHAIEVLSKRKLGQLDDVVVDILRIGLQQLFFMEVPAYAAVGETVELATKEANRARGFINAILRRGSERTADSIAPKGNSISDVAIRTAHPEWLIARWTRMYGAERARAIAVANQELSFPDLLIRRDAFDAAAEASLAALPHEASTLVDDMVRLRGGTSSLESDIRRGVFHPLDEGSAVVATLAATASRDLLDLAAAPGGKTLVMRNLGARVVSNDVSLGRLRPLIAAEQAMFGSRQIVVSDGRDAPFRRRFNGVLLDAPCSATGTLRKNPELKWRLRESELQSLAVLQRELLQSALDLTAKTCIYSTCSLEPEENDDVVDAVLAGRDDFERVDAASLANAAVQPWVRDGVLRLTPDSGTDGFTAFVLRRR
jgi:16S rRNA (cytosine967-C5)-methyltransferase